MQEVDRLYTLSPQMIDVVRSLTPNQLLLLVSEACRCAFEQVRITDPRLWQILEKMTEKDPAFDQQDMAYLGHAIDKFDQEYFTAQENSDSREEDYMAFFNKARAVSAVFQAVQGSSLYQAAVESIYEASMSLPNQQNLIERLLSISNCLVKPQNYTASAVADLYQQMFAKYYQSPVRAWDVKADSSINKDLYREVLNSVVETNHDSETDARSYWAPSPFEAAIFLMDLQTDQGFWRAEPGPLFPGQSFKTSTFKMVFRTQTADRVPFVPFQEWIDNEQGHSQARRELAAFCFLAKSITEKNVPISLPAFLSQTLAMRAGVPTKLLDWTSDPAMAVLNSMAAKPADIQATVFFTRFENLHGVVLPPPFGQPLIRQRTFFTAMNEHENAAIFSASSRISFPVTKNYQPPSAYPLFLPHTHFDKFAPELADIAHDLAKDASLPFEQLYSQDNVERTVALSEISNRLSKQIEELASKFNFSSDWWKEAINYWIFEIDRYVHELLGFTNSAGQLMLANESLIHLAKLNQEALVLYVDYIMAGKGPAFEQRQQFLIGQAEDLNALEERPLQTQVAAPEVVIQDLEDLLRTEPPKIIERNVSPQNEQAARAEDLVLLG
ncbi:MAG: hypothetical protein K2X81_10085 [Candidatus Obscuribacterales bacterium]|nr:hypothetical protein [Candidatus Obscuribacterales bacterium]